MTTPSTPDAAKSPADAIREFLLATGFDRVGFAAASRETPHAIDYRRWLEHGHAGGMDYLARTVEKRADPRLVLEGTRTILVVALHYPPPKPTLPTDEAASALAPFGRVAAYAQGEDYHRVMEKRLKRACASLRSTYNEQFRYYVDTGPVLERAWAHEAGVGWIGKNTCAIDPSAGSYFFLGVILTTLALPPDPPATDHCGSCTLCLEACPTEAFTGPYELDARRCISYLTIEHRDVVPTALAEQAGDWLFGCDLCQEVCPFNREAEQLPADGELAPRRENRAPRLAELAGLDEDTFRERFPRSAVRRAKSSGMLRNVMIALANDKRSNAEEVSEILNKLASRPDVQGSPVLRETLAWAREKRQA